MSKIDLPKINFNDKADSWELNNESKYVLTAKNINEIKKVVNELSNELSESLSFSDVYAYLRIEIPNNLTFGYNYDMQIDISENKEFSDIYSLKLSTNTERFFIFEKSIWKPFNKNYISYQDKNIVLAIKINDLISNKGLTYFGRYKFINNDNPDEILNFIGFCLGSYNSENIKYNNELEEIILSGVTSEACFELYENQSVEYKVIR